MVDEVALSVVLYTLGSPAAVLLSGGGGGRSKPGVGAGAGGRRGGWWRGHRSQAPSQGGQTMMGDSGREHVRCSKADRGEKRERRIIPSPQTQTGTGRGTGRAEKWCRCQCHPQPHALHNALPDRHRSPFAPTQAHLLRGPWSPELVGKRLFTSKVPTREQKPLGHRSCSPNTVSPACQGGHWGSPVLCAHPAPERIPGPPRAGELPREERDSVPTSVSTPQCSAENKNTSHLPAS